MTARPVTPIRLSALMLAPRRSCGDHCTSRARSARSRKRGGHAAPGAAGRSAPPARTTAAGQRRASRHAVRRARRPTTHHVVVGPGDLAPHGAGGRHRREHRRDRQVGAARARPGAAARARTGPAPRRAGTRGTRRRSRRDRRAAGRRTGASGARARPARGRGPRPARGRPRTPDRRRRVRCGTRSPSCSGRDLSPGGDGAPPLVRTVGRCVLGAGLARCRFVLARPSSGVPPRGAAGGGDATAGTRRSSGVGRAGRRSPPASRCRGASPSCPAATRSSPSARRAASCASRPAAASRRWRMEVPGVDTDAGEGGLLGLAVSPGLRERRARLRLLHDRRATTGSPASGSASEPRADAHRPRARATSTTAGGSPSAPTASSTRASATPATAELAQDPGVAERQDPAHEPRRQRAGRQPRSRGSRVWSLGHRNVQGLAWDDAGRLWATEFGQNDVGRGQPDPPGPQLRLAGGRGRGRHAGRPVHEPARHLGATGEASPSGAAIVGEPLYVAALRGEGCGGCRCDGRRAGDAGALLEAAYGRLRTVVRAPDGALWVATSNRDGRGAATRRRRRLPRSCACGGGAVAARRAAARQRASSSTARAPSGAPQSSSEAGVGMP